MDKNEKNKILEEVERGYDQMANKFSQTRKYFWADFDFIQDYIKNGDSILDFGCGNGRLMEVLKDKKIEYFGVDVSEKLVQIAIEKYGADNINFKKISSSESLPFPDNFFNSVISISVFHHFPFDHAKKMAEEIYKITKPGGKIIISVWNLWQRRHLRYFFDPRIIWKKIFQLGEYKGFGFKDIIIPFKNNQGEVFNRYHYAFTKKELKKIFKKAGFEIDKTSILNGKNILIIGGK